VSRDDGLLYTGTTSASFASSKERGLKERQAKEKELRQEVQANLRADATPILEVIAKEKRKIKFINEFAVEEMILPEHFQAEVIARKKYYAFLRKLETSIQVALGEVKS
jgi:hypothetical protein